MKVFTHITLALVAVLIASCGGGSSPQSEMNTLMSDMTKVLESVTDMGSVESAKSKLEPLAERMAKLSKEIQASASDPVAMSEKDAKELAETTQNFAKEYARVMALPEVGAALSETMAKIGQ